jgi:ectoine hydroxylase-related dioxygenase (phytanoyl-CoA dioxygenase family)
LLRNVVSREDIAVYRSVVRRAVDAFSSYSKSALEQEANAFKHSGFVYAFNLRGQDEAMLRFVLAKRFAKIAADLMGVDRVRVYLDEAFYKEVGSGPTHWHQDRLYFPVETDQMLALWIPLSDASAEMGTLDFATGSHRAGYFGYHPVSEEGSRHFDELIEERGYRVSKGGDMAAGDATCHNGWLLHGAGPNRGTRRREAMAITYYPDGSLLPEPLNFYQRRAIELAFGGKPGDLADGPLHPVVFDRRS